MFQSPVEIQAASNYTIVEIILSFHLISISSGDSGGFLRALHHDAYHAGWVSIPSGHSAGFLHIRQDAVGNWQMVSISSGDSGGFLPSRDATPARRASKFQSPAEIRAASYATRYSGLRGTSRFQSPAEIRAASYLVMRWWCLSSMLGFNLQRRFGRLLTGAASIAGQAREHKHVRAANASNATKWW